MPKKRILVIDDEADMVYFLKKNLEQTGDYEVITAVSGEEGLKAAFRCRPDLIFLDIIMPIMDGYEVLRKLKEVYLRKRPVPIAMITALRGSEHVSITEEFGVVDYITKPFKIDDVLRVISKCA